MNQTASLRSGPNVVTIDGPAGSGKSSTAREVAKRLGLRHLDSGALYRAVALGLLRAGVADFGEDTLDPAVLSSLDIALEPEGDGFRVMLGGSDPGAALRGDRVTELAARVARSPTVRSRLLPLQRGAVRFGGLVADGRDMGTVIFPDATLKVFLTAELNERARRRLVQDGRSAGREEIAGEAGRISARDQSDASRTTSPLRRAPEAFVLDTTELTFEEQVERIVRAAEDANASAHLSGSGGDSDGSGPHGESTG